MAPFTQLRPTRKHTDQRSVAQHPMVDKRSSRVKRSKDNQRIGRHFMNLLYRAGECTVTDPWRGYLSQTKQGERVAACELQKDSGDWNRDEQRVQEIVSKPSGPVEPCTKYRRFDWRRWIGKSPKQAQD